MGDPVFSHVRYSQIALLLQFCDFRCVPSLVFELSECLAFDYRSNQHSDESSSSGKIAPETMSGRIENPRHLDAGRQDHGWRRRANFFFKSGQNSRQTLFADPKPKATVPLRTPREAVNGSGRQASTKNGVE